MEMGELIKNLRIEKGLTQEELGNLLGLKKAAINKYESGRVENIKRSVIQKMADIFDVSPAYLMGWENEKKETKSNSNLIKTEEHENDIEKIIDELMDQQGLMLCGEPMSNEDMMLLRNSIRSTIELAKTMKNNKK